MTTATTTILPATQMQTIENDYTLKGYTPRQGRDTLQFDATIWNKGKKVGSVSNSGSGGSHLFYFTSPEEREAFTQFVAQHTWTWASDEFNHDEDSVFDMLARETREVKWLNSTAKRKNATMGADNVAAILAGQFYVYPANATIPAGSLVWNGSDWETK